MPLAATSMTFADFRLVKGRKQAQFIFECPMEQADAALNALGGLPQSDQARWVAVALMQTPAQPVKEPKPWKSLPLSQRAAIRINDPQFQNWIGAVDAEGADKWVKATCGIGSKRDLDLYDSPGKAAWDKIDYEYRTAVGLLVEPR